LTEKCKTVGGRGGKNFLQSFALLSLGFAFPGSAALPCPEGAATTTSSVKREAASSQFAKAEEMRAALSAKPSPQRSLADYKRVVASYQRVYLITPHAGEVPESLMAVGELNTEMGDRFGRSFYQAAADSYSFLIREYPNSKQVQEAMLRVGKLQKDQLGEPVAATKTFQDFLKKYPRSPNKREAQEALAELALLRNTEPGEPLVAKSAGASTPPALTAETAPKNLHTTISGGEPAKSGAVPRVRRIRATPTPDSTEIVIDLDDSVQFASGRIANPDRIYFDLHAAQLAPGLAHADFPVTGDLVTKIRVAQNQSGVVRVVLDIVGVKDYEASLTKKPARLVIELYGNASRSRPDALQAAKTGAASKPTIKHTGGDTSTDSQPLAPEFIAPNPATERDAAARLSASTAAGVPAPPARPSSEPRKTLPTKPPKAGTSRPDFVQPASAPQPTHDGQSTLTRTLGLKISRIVIDAGHGGHDTGTVGPTGLMEKDLCLDVALRLGKLFEEKLPGTEVVYTRSDDTFIPLEERTRIANEAKADLFVSIHANSSPDKAARGIETYYLNLKGSAEAMEVAARENATSQQNIHDLEDLVKRIARTEKIDESKELAEDIQDSLSKRVQRTARTVRNRGVRKAPFVVLIGADMPSILTEISFLSNPSDEQLLKKPEHRQRIAEGVYQGVAQYLESMNSLAVNTSGRPARTPVVASVEQSRNQK
jgi:N-acetylmuramoyl-L-alanine amidase